MTFDITPLSRDADVDIRRRIDARLKPPGALGELETLALQLVRLLGDSQPQLTSPTLLLFAGDHGVVTEGVSVAGAEVTALMVSRFGAGDASVNVFCRQAQMALRVIDCGIVTPPAAQAWLTDARLGAGTAPLHREAAMSLAQLDEGLANGRRLAHEQHHRGSNLIALGEMGIGNTTSASALMAALTRLPVSACVGDGSGIDADTYRRKRDIVTQALARHAAVLDSPRDSLAALGGFEIVTMVGAILGAAECGMAVLVDGFITTVAACYACRLYPATRDYLIFAHCGSERGHRALLDELEARPLLSLQLRMGEGAGAALALPLLRSALAFYNEMASFADVGLDLSS
ncbi:nicotinate-nucleotide--dimethylbenzimidazole phosphoribosyltransferase [Kushneria aurantia]|uniref:Nicotinate-nucleotide--dimethylbenzimidazole phosphoribosyltransferase n=1 Tax=Kushneria aurantia TaxID=504092 RepID=A0ABV6G5K6_9GAMM|nr:nicotinate-nucleotide--dimethylbenzimidazole phosphoribosyltransferase [Kushneria aurantia]